MCIKCAHQHALILAAVFARDTGAIADFTLPPAPHEGAMTEADHRQSIGILGEIITAVVPMLAARASGGPMSVVDAGDVETSQKIAALFNTPRTIAEGKTVPGGAAMASVALVGYYYADLLMYAMRQVEEVVRQQMQENPTFPGPRRAVELLEGKRLAMAAKYLRPVEYVNGDMADDMDFPAEMPEPVRDILRKARAAGIPLESIAIVEQPGAARPVGTSPDGKLH